MYNLKIIWTKTAIINHQPITIFDLIILIFTSNIKNIEAKNESNHLALYQCWIGQQRHIYRVNGFWGFCEVI